MARVFATITLPLAARGIASGMLLAFARAIGEFGATILVAGNIPGRTTTLSLAIYNFVQLGRDAEAYRLLAAPSLIAFAAVWITEAFPAEARVSVVLRTSCCRSRRSRSRVSVGCSARTTALYGPSGAGKTRCSK